MTQDEVQIELESFVNMENDTDPEVLDLPQLILQKIHEGKRRNLHFMEWSISGNLEITDGSEYFFGIL